MAAPERVFGVEELTGWRVWRVIGDSYSSAGDGGWRVKAGLVESPKFVRLESVTQTTDHAGVDGVWPAGRWFEGRCLRDALHNVEGGGIPVERCSCGIYAAKTLAQMNGMSYYWSRSAELEDVCVGEVAFAGKVIEGSQGWRAEKARVKRLWLPHSMWRYAEPLEEAYRCEVGFASFLNGAIVLDPDDEEVTEDGDR
ncbi:MAG TPA: hypothetical protein VG265_13405 [Gaiellaceae bacterium]|jgi:hypothetical protein|nr:hypothetical protein [Gaiellaceae bacterium]